MAASNVCSSEILKKHSGISENYDNFQTVVKIEDGEKLDIDLSVKCRGCFVEDPKMHYLFAVFDQHLSLADILIETTAVECTLDDGFPPYLCTRCTTSLIDFFNFKIQLHKTELYVRTLLANTSSSNVIEAQSECNADDFILDEKHGTFQSQYDSQDDNSVDIKSFNHVKDTPDIKNLSGLSSPRCETCLLVLKDIDECETHMAKKHGKNPFEKYGLFRQQITEQAKAAIKERKKRRFQEYTLKKEILMMEPGKYCRICKAKYPEDEFSAHWALHKKHVCEECGHRCVKKSDLHIHMLSVHNDERNFSCADCDKSFKTKPLLKRHQVVHLNPRTYCCDLCGQRFNDGGTLKTHIQLKHIRSRDFICPICGLSFPMKATLEKHILRHNKNRPASFSCHICSIGFKDKSSLTRHHLVKHSNIFVKPSCQFCGKSYYSSTKLNYHIERQHSGNIVERQKRSSKKLKYQQFSSNTLTDTEDSNDVLEETSSQDQNSANVIDSYRSSPRYQDVQMEDDSSYVVYQPSLHLEEDTESENMKSESD
ncbi:zinc finger protein 337 [Dendroctonus ponderosae]|uniref:Protein krueppel n=1 Tax=Dendroctonus ponderosae TaxID=77166 RepID=U4U9I0_DENPD|nr:zinc finger protein 337 [Dendroctonus ponderosae]ERL88983.1 hypothetical protein D910_06361 [Dendroctonus ponderosae]KAH1017066.1 hypothetical protein HUJ05_007787 [Dendroctonus ponderosae]